jgi:mannose-6-phosphate isomerase-like protein (cupin superfamily)
MSEITKGEGYAIGHIDDMGDRYGFRKVRRALDVTAFGVNALVLPPNYDAGRHFHDEQQELYFVHSGTVEMRFEDGTTHRMEPGTAARVDAATVRGVANVGEEDAVLLVAGGKDGYVGRDGRMPEGEQRGGGPAE